MKFKLVMLAIGVTLFLGVLSRAVMAQGEPPSPYSGMKNPFPWSDNSVQAAGKGIYQLSCLGCHGAQGNNLANANFSQATFPQVLESRADFYFWTLSEGRLAKGMPAYKSSLSEEQRWQVLTYLWSLGKATSPTITPPFAPSVAEGESSVLELTVSEESQSKQQLTLTVTLRNKEGRAISSAAVKFFIRVNFFTRDLIEIGEALTNDQGVAGLEYTPKQTGDIEVVARYKNVDVVKTVIPEGRVEPSYQTEAGLWYPLPLPEVLVGPESALVPREMGRAPITGFRIPGGLPAVPFLAYLFTVMLVWSLYLRVMYQVLCIPKVTEIRDTNTRLVPLIAMTIMAFLLLMLVFILTTGPYTNPHLLH